MMFERAAGVKLTHVPFKGAAEVHNAVASKQIMLAAMNIGEALQYQKGGTPLRHLGQMSEKRSTLAPNVPTFKEQGFNVIMASLRGVAAPKGLPPAVREQLVNALQKAVADPEFQAKAAGYFAPLRYLAPAAYAAELKEDEAELQDSCGRPCPGPTSKSGCPRTSDGPCPRGWAISSASTTSRRRRAGTCRRPSSRMSRAAWSATSRCGRTPARSSSTSS